jgi:hypothetical protein
MADEAEVSKLIGHVYTAPPVSAAVVSKLIMYVWAIPGTEGGGGGSTPDHRAFTYGQRTKQPGG